MRSWLCVYAFVFKLKWNSVKTTIYCCSGACSARYCNARTIAGGISGGCGTWSPKFCNCEKKAQLIVRFAQIRSSTDQIINHFVHSSSSCTLCLEAVLVGDVADFYLLAIGWSVAEITLSNDSCLLADLFQLASRLCLDSIRLFEGTRHNNFRLQWMEFMTHKIVDWLTIYRFISILKWVCIHNGFTTKSFGLSISWWCWCNAGSWRDCNASNEKNHLKWDKQFDKIFTF